MPRDGKAVDTSREIHVEALWVTAKLAALLSMLSFFGCRTVRIVCVCLGYFAQTINSLGSLLSAWFCTLSTESNNKTIYKGFNL